MSAANNVVQAFPPAPSLHAGLLDGLRALVNEGHLLPGTRVPERELCVRFGVSRTPLRECLKVLAAEGLVELLPNRGARIATLDDEHLVHLFEVIAMLEAEGGRLACLRIQPAELEEPRRPGLAFARSDARHPRRAFVLRVGGRCGAGLRRLG